MVSSVKMLLMGAAVMVFCLSSVAEAQVSTSQFTPQQIAEATKIANAEMRKRKKEIKTMVNGTNTLPDGSSGSVNNLFRRASPEAIEIGEEAERDLSIARALNVTVFTKKLSEKTGIRASRRGRQKVGILDNTEFSLTCKHKIPQCDFQKKYREIDGSCNNINNPKWGQALTALVRLLDPDYANGLDEPRVGVSGNELPSARIVSREFTNMFDNPSNKHTHMLMQWGQFLDHDITLTPIFTIRRGAAYPSLKCCDPDQIPEGLEKQCFPIDTTGDSFYDVIHNKKCMEFTRSQAAMRRDCEKYPREQLNEITAYIDASNVYGSDEETAKALRTNDGSGAYLIMDGEHLPRNPGDPGCRRPNNLPPSDPKQQCFHAGDKRANEQPNLIAMHTIWVIHHNNVVRKLAEINNWSNEKLYQEARRIVGAQMQHITYNEFLPIVLGKNYANNQNLLPAKNGYSDTYDRFKDASIANEFATAAYRFGHSLIQGTIKTFDSEFQQTGQDQLNEVSFKPEVFSQFNMLQRLIRGLIQQKMQKFDKSFATEIRDKLFSTPIEVGMDLVALNTQRGRDHGLPSYKEYRKFCCLGKLRKDLKRKQIKRLRNVYGTLRNVDLFIGGVLEKPANGALVGRTFRCLIGEQFKRLKYGDRFYYETKNEETRFTRDQLDEIRKTTLARIICENTGVDMIQPKAFFRHTRPGNQRRNCRNYNKIPALPDLNLWKE